MTRFVSHSRPHCVEGTCVCVGVLRGHSHRVWLWACVVSAVTAHAPPHAARASRATRGESAWVETENLWLIWKALPSQLIPYGNDFTHFNVFYDTRRIWVGKAKGGPGLCS